MAFGAKITDYAQGAIGSYGYIVKINTTAMLFYTVNGVQAQPSAISTPAPASGEVTLATLLAYLDSSSCPDLAYNFSNGELTIFFKTSVFDYVDGTRFAIFGLRNAQKTTDDADYLDFPEKDERLFINYVLRSAYELVKGKSTRDIDEIIELEELRINNE